MESASQTLNVLIRTILQGARSLSADLFQEWALDQLKTVIPFDAGIWVSGTIKNKIPVMHTLHLHHLPAETLDACVRRFESEEAFLARVLECPGTTVDLYDVMEREAFIKSELYRTYASITGMEQALATAIMDPENEVLNMIALYRHDYSNPFRPEEKQTKEFISPILVDAWKLNLCIDLLNNGPGICAEAICDYKGIIREAGSDFSTLMLEEWPEWDGSVLHFDLQTLLDCKQDTTFQGGKIVIHMRPRNNLILLHARKKDDIDCLTASEQEITRHLSEGLSNKEIASTLGISVKTVDNHLQHIYRKLGVTNRKRIIATLKNKS